MLTPARRFSRWLPALSLTGSHQISLSLWLVRSLSFNSPPSFSLVASTLSGYCGQSLELAAN